MIHLLEIDPDLEVAQLKKLSRRYAMTGGYEITLKQGLTTEDISVIARRFIPELDTSARGSSAYKTSNAYRILSLILQMEDLDIALKEEVAQYL